MGKIFGILGMFTSILIILRWFKQDTAEMIKIYSESTDKKLKDTDRRLEAMDRRLDAMDRNIDAIKFEMKDFHNRLIEAQKTK
jgi:hypothetical protein